MTDNQKLQARLNLLYKKSGVIMGAAAAELDTVTGAEKQLAKAKEAVAIKLGEQGALTRSLIVLQQKLLSIQLPDYFYAAAGAAVDFGAVMLTVFGTLASYTLLIAKTGTILGVLASNITLNTTLAALLTAGFAKLSAAVGVQTVAVTTLNTVWLNLARVFKGFVISGFSALGSFLSAVPTKIAVQTKAIFLYKLSWAGLTTVMLPAVKAGAIALAGFAKSAVMATAAFVASPLFIVGSAIVAAIVFMYQAVKDLRSELSFLGESAKSSSGSVSLLTRLTKAFGKAWEGLKNTFIGIYNFILGIFKLIASNIALSGLKISKLISDIDVLTTFNEKKKDIAIRRSDLISDDINELEAYMKKTGSEMMRAFEQGSIEATKNRLSKTFTKEKEVSEKLITEVKRKYESFISQSESLQRSNLLFGKSEIEKAKINERLKLKEIKLLEKDLGLTRQLTPEKKAQLDIARNLVATEAQNRIDERLLETINKTKSINQELSDRFKTELQLIDVTRKRSLGEIDLLENQLRLSKELTAEREKQLDAARSAIRNKAEMDKAASVAGSTSLSQNLGSLAGALSSAFGKGASALSSSISSAASSAGMLYLSAADKIADSAIAIIDFFPNFISKLGSIFQRLTDFPGALTKSLSSFFDSVISFVSDFIPNLLDAAIKILDQIPEKLITGLTDSFTSLVDRLPDIISRFFDRLPEIAEKLVEAIIRAIPRIITSLFKLRFIFVQIFIESAKAMGEVLIKIFKGLFTGIKDLFAGQSIKKISDAIKTAAKSTGNLFKVEDLEEQAGSFMGVITEDLRSTWQWVLDQIWTPIEEGWRNLWETIKSIWDEMITALEGVWNSIAVIWQGLLSALSNVWREISSLWDGLKNIIISSWNEVELIWHGLEKSWMGVWGEIETGWHSLESSWQTVWTSISNSWKDVWDLISASGSALGKIWKDSFIWIKDNIWDKFSDGISSTWSAIDKNIFIPLQKSFLKLTAGLKTNLVDPFKEKIIGPIQGLTKQFFKMFSPLKDLTDGIQKLFEPIAPVF